MSIWDDLKYQFNRGDSAIRKIIFINIGAFVASILITTILRFSGVESSDGILSYLYLNQNPGITLIRPWTIVTNIFMHGGFRHILSNMLWLFFIGTVFQDFGNNKRVYTTFIGGGIAGGLLFMLVYNIAPAFIGKNAYLLGASGGVTSIIIAAAVLLPYYEFRPFGLFSIQMRWIALFRLATDFMSLPEMTNTGGTLAHLGGALFGFLYMKQIKGELNLPSLNFKIPNPFKRRPKMKVDERSFYRKSEKAGRSSDPSMPNQAEIDAILDKISQSGYESLTADEKNKLFKASE